MIKKYYYSEKFEKNLRKLDKSLRKEVIEEINNFALDPSLPHYKIHSLKKELTGWLAASLAPDLRIVFKFTKTDKSEIVIHNVGTHEIYK